MDTAFGRAIGIMLTGDPELLGIAARSIAFSLLSTLIATVIALPLAVWLGRGRFRGRKASLAAVQALTSIPTVVLALAVYSLISRRGPLGDLGLLFTPTAIIIGQVFLIAPIVIAVTAQAMESIDPAFGETMRTFRVPAFRRLIALILETLPAIFIAVITAFGRAVGEVGVSMVLGGNIRFRTRTMTTAIALETQRGDFELSIALGVILLIIALVVNFALRLLARKAAET